MAALAPAQPSLLDDVARPARGAPSSPVAGPGSRPVGPPGGERTLEDLVLGAWEELAVAATASCPLCGGALAPRFGAGARPVAGCCADCATEVR